MGSLRIKNRIYIIIKSTCIPLPESELPMPAERFVRVTHALSDGLTFAHFMTPELIDRDVIVAAFEAFAGNSSPSPSPSP